MHGTHVLCLQLVWPSVALCAPAGRDMALASALAVHLGGGPQPSGPPRGGMDGPPYHPYNDRSGNIMQPCPNCGEDVAHGQQDPGPVETWLHPNGPGTCDLCAGFCHILDMMRGVPKNSDEYIGTVGLLRNTRRMLASRCGALKQVAAPERNVDELERSDDEGAEASTPPPPKLHKASPAKRSPFTNVQQEWIVEQCRPVFGGSMPPKGAAPQSSALRDILERGRAEGTLPPDAAFEQLRHAARQWRPQ